MSIFAIFRIGAGARQSLEATPETAAPALANTGARAIWRLTLSLLIGLLLMMTLASMAMAASPGCAAVNRGDLNYTGTSPAAQLGVVLAQFYPGDQLFMTYTTNTPKSGVVLDLILTSVSVNTIVTGATGTTHSQTATVGALLPIGAKAGITDLTAGANPRNVVMTVTCSAATAPTTLVVTSNPILSIYGQSVALAATLSSIGGTPNGNVVFSIDGVAQPPVAISNGVATLNTAAITAGGHSVTASYAGNSNFSPSSGTLLGGQGVLRASTTTAFSSSAATSPFGSTVTFTATTAATAPGAGTPDGSVIFTIDGTDQAPVALSGGVATLANSTLSIGNHYVAVRYGGSTNYNTSSSGLGDLQVITKAATTAAVTQTAATTTFGQTATFRATLSSAAGTPTGSVVFTIDGAAQTPVALSNGIAELSTSSLAVGNHTVSASYAGTATLLASSGALAGGHTVTVIPTTTALSGPGTIVFGNSATVIANVTSASGTPTGSITFTVDGVARAPVALGSGSASVILTGLAAGSHSVSAAYAGTATFGLSNGALSGGQVVSKAATTTAVSAITPVTLGQSINVLATVTSVAGTPDGTVVFTVDGVAQAPVTLVNGQASIVVPGLGVGDRAITAAYSGATNFSTSTGAATAAINKAASSLVVASSANPSVTGQGLTFTATASSAVGTPAGAVVFTIDGVEQSPVSLSNGGASFSRPAMSVGSHTVTASYQGSANLLPSSASLPGGQTVARSATAVSLSSDTSSAAFGATVAFTAQVAAVTPGAGTPTGNVVFSVDGVAQAPVALSSGSATIARANLAVGGHTVTALYVGDTDFGSSTGALSGGQAVIAAATTTSIAFAPVSPRLGETATVTATVAAANGVPTGNVIFTVNGTDQAPVSLVNGVAQFGLTDLAVGSYTLGSRFVGTTSFVASTASDAVMTVGAATTTTAVSAGPASIRLGEATTISATVSAPHGTPSGTVEFRNNGTLLGTATLTNGTASLSTSALTRGDHAITVMYAGSTDHVTSTGTLATPIAVSAGSSTLTIAATPQPATFGQPITVSATASAIVGTPSGTVIFTVDGVALPAATLSGGAASVLLPSLEPGSHTVGASYGGSADHLPASASLAGGVVIDKAAATLDLTTTPVAPVFGDVLTVVAILASSAGTPTGDVTFVVDGVAQTPVPPTSGTASINLSGLGAGAHSIEARFAGDARFDPITTTLAGGVELARATTAMALTASPDPARFGDTVSFTANVTASSGTATGAVVFTIDGVAQSPVSLSGGAATLTTAGLTVGPHTVTAAFAAQGNFGASTAALPGGIDVDVATTSASLKGPATAVALGETARFVATVATDHGTPTGAVVFTVDGFAQAPIALSHGSAALDIVFPGAGSHTVTATYAGAASFAPSSASLAGGIAIGKATSQAVLTVAPTAPFGSAVTASVAVSSTAGTPGGSVIFYVNGNAAGTAVLTNGVATLVLPGLSATDHEITAEYAGDLNFAASSAAGVDISIVPAAVTLSVSASAPTVTAGQPVTISVNADRATGDVTISVGVVDHVVPLQNGVASLTLSNLAAGTYPVTVAYAGSAEFAAQTASLTADLVVAAAPTDIQVSASLPRSVAGTAYTASVTAYGGVAPYAYAVTDGALPSGLSLNGATGAITGAPSAAGAYSWEITATGSAGAPGVYQASLTVLPATTITLPTTLTDATYGVSFQGSVAATGGTAPISYAVTSGNLPPGLSLNGATGAITGSPTQLGTASFTIGATDGNGFTGSSTLILTVVAPTITASGTFPDAVAATPYAGSVTVGGGIAPYSFSLDGTLPAGLTLDLANGSVSGTPTQAGAFDFAILVADANGFGTSLDVEIQIDAQPVIVLPATLAVPRQNRPYAQALAATGGAGGYSYAVTGGVLPAGITLNAGTGRLSGTPTGSGPSTFEISSTDSAGLVGVRSYTLDVQPAAVLVVDASLDPVVAGVTYGDTIGVTGGAAPYSFTIVSGSLPAGLSLDPATGDIAGNTLVPGTYSIVLDIADAGGDSVTSTVTLQVGAPTIALTATATGADFGNSVSGSVTLSGGTAPYSYAVTSGALPAGVTVDPATGDIAGTATEAGSFTAVITATDANSFSGSTTIAIDITAPTLSLSALPTEFMLGRTVSETLVASGGRAPYVFSVTGNLPAGLTLDPNTGLLSGTPLAIGQRSFTITAEDADGFAVSSSYTVEIVTNVGNATLPGTPALVTAGAAYSASLAATGGAAPLSYSISTGALPAGLALDPVTGELTGATLATGSFTFQVTVTGADGRSNSATYTIVSAAPSMSASGQPGAAEAGTAYAGTLAVSGGTAPYAYALKSGNLPAGLALDAAGQILGTPTEAGSFSLVATVTDDNGFATDLTFNLTVAAPSISLTASITDGRIGQPYTGSVSATGGVAPLRYTITSGALPDGIVLDGDTGELSGTPISSGPATFTITATDANGFTGASTHSMLVATNVGTASMPASLPDAVAGDSYTGSVQASGGATPYDYAVTAGGLPPGLTLDSATGAISGTPITAGDFSFGITVTDDDGLINHQSYQVSITAPLVEVVATPSPAEAGAPYSATVLVTGGTAPYDFVLEDAPPGIVIDTTGLLSGTPTRAGTYNFAVLVTDANGFRSAGPMTLVVAAAPIALLLPAGVPDAVEGDAYSASFVPGNAVGAVQYTSANGTTLPAGLQLDGATGIISGTPTTPGTYSFDIHAVDANGNVGEATYAMTVAADAPPVADTTTVALTVGSTSAAVGESITLDIVVTTTSGTADEGVVTIVDTASGDTIASGAIAADGTASFTVDFTTAGGRTLVALYAGTTRFDPSDSAVRALSITPATTTLVLSSTAGSVPAGTPILIVARAARQAPATGAAGPGTIVFAVDGVDVETSPASGGSASHTLDLAPGEHQIEARFEPSGADDTGSSSTVSVVIIAATTTSLAAPTGDITTGQTVTFTATVTPTVSGVPMTGDVIFTDNGTALATVPLANGTATFAMTAGADGDHAISASFSGDTYYEPSASPVITHRVVQPPVGSAIATTTTVVADNTAPQVNQALTLTATVVGDGVTVPTGSVTFENTTTGVAVVTTPVDATGTAVTTLALIDSGTTEITATYTPDTATWLDSADSVILDPIETETEISLSPSATSVLPDETVMLTAEVSRPAGGIVDAGTVAFLANGTPFAHVPTDGAAEVQATSDPLIGPTLFTAEFIPGPNSDDAPATSTAVTVTTVIAVPVVTVTASVANDGSATVSVDVAAPAGMSQVPTGDVTLSAGAVADQTQPLAGGAASFTYPAGSFINTGVSFVASYQGNSQFLPASGTATVDPAGTIPTQTVVQLSATWVQPDQTVVATVTVTASPPVDGGLVEVWQNGSRVATAPVHNSVADVTLTGLQGGENTVTAHYLGTDQYAPSSAAAAMVAVMAAPLGSLSLTLTADATAIFSAGQVISVMAQVSANGASASGILVSSAVSFSCPRTSLGAGESMTCTGLYLVTAADVAAGQLNLLATATGDNLAPVSASLTLQSAAQAVSDTFETLSQDFVADRARALGSAIPLPDILLRRQAGSRAGTVQASNGDSSQEMSFTSSLAEWRNWAAAQAADGLALGMLDEPLPVNIWVDAQFSLHASTDGDERWGQLGTLAVGADYLITDDILAGLMMQGDWSANTASSGSVGGSGFLVGPYVSIALNDHLSFDATVLHGQSSNTASAAMLGETFAGSFDTTRLYGKAALTGYFEIDALTVRPNATFLLTSESTGDYTVTNDKGAVVSVPGGNHLQYQLTVGATAEYAIALDNGATLTPMVGLDLGFNGAIEDDEDLSGSILGRLTTGITFETDTGLQLGLEFDTELDSSGFTSARARATIKGNF